MLHTLFFEKMCVLKLNLHFSKKNTDVEQKTNLRSGKNKDKEREFERKKKRGNQQKRERIDEQKLCNLIF